MANFSLAQYIRESWMELKNVTWPTKEELRKHTVLVIIFSVAMAAFLSLCDWVFKNGIESIFIR